MISGHTLCSPCVFHYVQRMGRTTTEWKLKLNTGKIKVTVCIHLYTHCHLDLSHILYKIGGVWYEVQCLKVLQVHRRRWRSWEHWWAVAPCSSHKVKCSVEVQQRRTKQISTDCRASEVPTDISVCTMWSLQRNMETEDRKQRWASYSE